MQRILSQHLSLTFAGLSFCLNMSEMAFVAKYASFFQTYNSDVREDAKTYMTVFFFLQFLCRQIIELLLSEPSSLFFTVGLCLRIWCGRRRSSFSSLTFHPVARGYFVMTETARVSVGTLSMCFPLITLSHFHLNVGFLSFLTLGDWSSFHNFEPWRFEFSSSDQ